MHRLAVRREEQEALDHMAQMRLAYHSSPEEFKNAMRE